MTHSSDDLARIEAGELRRHIEANDVFLLDVRKHVAGKQIYGAIRYDPRKLSEAEKLVLPLPKEGGLIVLYDDDGTSTILRDLAGKLEDHGYGPVRSLAGGFKAWHEADGKLEDATVEQPVPLVSKHQIER